MVKPIANCVYTSKCVCIFDCVYVSISMCTDIYVTVSGCESFILWVFISMRHPSTTSLLVCVYDCVSMYTPGSGEPGSGGKVRKGTWRLECDGQKTGPAKRSSLELIRSQQVKECRQWDQRDGQGPDQAQPCWPRWRFWTSFFFCLLCHLSLKPALGGRSPASDFTDRKLRLGIQK